ncbi:MAG: 2-oxoacid:acceptor oxidoreductase subunit alpha [Bacteroidetes bacterium]|nr:2-oxoacid:acceptor oxidoreductase subunit alpha [Bacteroidota bacterium]MBP7398985.1 2-oxoacid:acceptor oxidoreductase subunit alpha [Chitinophagales bacterium]MBK8486178.1 2-oxoacid:acceptor oxidoreductase subunit alpha [Bacteroidota bacterium]MBK8681124.1 2-oxoacid:acceptor oxidoreductase subunit alpha [Bacteroidota bacterium]MBP8754393.1 2-oxoacid:acceptor oxidoreductase subunit alpha [Chitinophagales bacterium]
MPDNIKELEHVVIKFAGDSGDGMQLTGGQFTNNTALLGSDLQTFPDFPAEIRAPAGTLPGVSGFQLHFGSRKIFTPGDNCDVLVAMNAAALKVNLKALQPGATIIVNTDGFDSKNLRLAEYAENPLENDSLDNYPLIKIDVTKLTREALKDIPLGVKEKDRCKNMFVLGFLYYMYSRSLDSTIRFLELKFKGKLDILEANKIALNAGFSYADTTEVFTSRYRVAAAPMDKGVYRSIMGNEAVSMGLIAASKKSGLPLFLGSYPITPASDILHYLARYKNFGVRTFQAEDEIAAISASIGAAFGGQLAITTTSGPGMALKGEAMGLAVMLEMPLVIINIQRAGPSTGLPTKTEQADLLQALYGRNGECPMPVLAAKTPSDAFFTAFEACRIAMQHMTPVILLSDGYIANGAEPWKFPKAADLPEIPVSFAPPKMNGEVFHPYERNEKLARPWAIPGTKGLEHRIGGLEKANITGNISYDPDNHEFMVKLREEKVERIAQFLPDQEIDLGDDKGKLLVLGWGSTYGAIQSAVTDLLNDGYAVSHVHLRHLKPFPKNLGEILFNFDKVLIPEINNGQLVKVIRDKFMIPAIAYNKIKGVPITSAELKEIIVKELAEQA